VMDLISPATVVRVSGELDHPGIAFDLPEATLTARSADGTVTAAKKIDLTVGVQGLTGSYLPDGKAATVAVLNRALTLVYSGPDPETEEPTRSEVAVADIAVTGHLTQPEGGMDQEFEAALRNGLSMGFDIETGQNDWSFTGAAAGEPVSGKLSLATSSNHFTLDSKAFDFATGFAGFALTVRDAPIKGGGRVDVDFGLEELKVGASGSHFIGVDPGKDMAAAIRAGFTMDARFGMKGISTRVNGTGAGGPFKFDLKQDTFSTDMKVDAKRVSLGFAATGVGMTGQALAANVPELDAGLDEAAVRIELPSLPSEIAGDFVLSQRLINLRGSDAIWNLFDPEAGFPRDPVSFVADLSGKVRILTDIFAQDEKGGPGRQDNVLPEEIAIRELTFKGFGVSASGEGGLTFDLSDMETFNGVPKPEGSLTFAATGINAAMGRLAKLGVATPDGITGFRMILAMFARPGEAEDSLTSSIEFGADGVYVNGVKMR
jgi:hypothetical protein